MSDSEQPYLVWLVEDDDDHAELAEYHVHQTASDAVITRLADGGLAVEYLERYVDNASEETPDLVLLDLKLPKLDGIGVLAKMRETREFDSVPVVMLSTSNADGDKQRAYAHHVSSYTVKPDTFEEYGALIREMIGYWRYRNQRPQRR